MRKHLDLGEQILIKEIDSCLEEEWEETEIFYITQYKQNGFDLLNVSKGGCGVVTAEMRSIDSMTRSAIGHQKPVIALNLDGSFYKEYTSVKEAAKDINILTTSIGNVLSGRSKSAGGYIWVYKQKYSSNEEYNYHPGYLDMRIPVYLFDVNGNLAKTLDKLSDAEKIKGWSENGIRHAIDNKTIYHGYYPSYSKTINVDDYLKNFKYKILDKDGNIIKYLNLLEEALKIMNTNTYMYYKNVKNNEFKYNDKTLIKL